MPSISRNKKSKIIKKLNKYKLIVKTLPSVSQIIDGRVTVSDIKDFNTEDLLNRDQVKPDTKLLNKNINKLTKGRIKAQIIETPVNIPNSIKPIKIWGPYNCNCITRFGFFLIINPEKIWDPSNGGIGIMLKTANDILI